jgi:hypothetical protein
MWRAIKDLPEMRSRLSNGKDSPEAWLEAIRSIGDCSVVPCEQLEPAIRRVIQKFTAKLTARRNVGAEFVQSTAKPQWKLKWFYDPRLGGALNHTTRSRALANLYEIHLQSQPFPLPCCPSTKTSKARNRRKLSSQTDFVYRLRTDLPQQSLLTSAKTGITSFTPIPLSAEA